MNIEKWLDLSAYGLKLSVAETSNRHHLLLTGFDALSHKEAAARLGYEPSKQSDKILVREVSVKDGEVSPGDLPTLAAYRRAFPGAVEIPFDRSTHYVRPDWLDKDMEPRPFGGGDAMEKADELREFFRSEEVLRFLDEYCAGAHPWALVMDGDRRLVLASPDRNVFYVVTPTPHAFVASLASDPIAVIDPESESEESIGTFDDAATAFEAVARHAGLATGRPAP